MCQCLSRVFDMWQYAKKPLHRRSKKQLDAMEKAQREGKARVRYREVRTENAQSRAILHSVAHQAQMRASHMSGKARLRRCIYRGSYESGVDKENEHA